ncbi:MAG: hypothetical protein ABJJ53_09720 [Sulfitobacter sp.]
MPAKILMDGSNVVFWRGGQADSAVPDRVACALLARRFMPHIFFDHSIWRHLGQDQLDHLAAIALVTIAPRGTPADALLLQACQRGRFQIVSNDRFRAWRGEHPLLRKDWLVTGSIGKGGRVGFSKMLRPAPI